MDRIVVMTPCHGLAFVEKMLVYIWIAENTPIICDGQADKPIPIVDI